jgi:hypothetical protein
MPPKPSGLKVQPVVPFTPIVTLVSAILTFTTKMTLVSFKLII